MAVATSPHRDRLRPALAHGTAADHIQFGHVENYFNELNEFDQLFAHDDQLIYSHLVFLALPTRLPRFQHLTKPSSTTGNSVTSVDSVIMPMRGGNVRDEGDRDDDHDHDDSGDDHDHDHDDNVATIRPRAATTMRKEGRQAYIKQLERTVLALSPGQVVALPPPTLHIRELDQEIPSCSARTTNCGSDVRHPRRAAWNFLIELADVQSRWWQRNDLSWREREHGTLELHEETLVVPPSASWSPLAVESSPHCRRGRGRGRRHCCRVGVVFFMVVSLRHRSRGRGRVVGASLHRSPSSLTLPPRIGMITESTESGWKSQEDEVGVDELVVVGEELVELVELVEVVLDVAELYVLKIEEDDEREVIELESEETCDEGVGEGLETEERKYSRQDNTRPSRDRWDRRHHHPTFHSSETASTTAPKKVPDVARRLHLCVEVWPPVLCGS
ncbi:hypothetical protein EDB83DRAFT_2682978 [Lactarius deliciosus]|nr:hypothetical protein EDB83DRAFT_2682978 [Lactarius deliciosus]